MIHILNLLGMINIIKSVGLSKLGYHASVLQVQLDETISTEREFSMDGYHVHTVFYEKMLQYWFEFKYGQSSNKMPRKKMICRENNRDIKIDNKTLLFRTCFDKGIYTLKDLVSPNLDFSVLKNSNCATNRKTNFFRLLWSKKCYFTRIRTARSSYHTKP